MAVSEVYRIGEWVFTPGLNLLEAGGETVRLEDRASRALALLCRRQGDVVSREDLIQEVWNGRTVSANSVAVVISDLRKALRDTPRRPRFIHTVAKRGYRLMECRPFTAADERAAGNVRPFVLRPAALLAIASLLLISLASFVWMAPSHEGSPHRPVVIAMNDIRNMTGDDTLDPLATAISEMSAVFLTQVESIILVRHRWKVDEADPSGGLYDSFGRQARAYHLTGKLIVDGDAPTLALFANNPDTDQLIWSRMVLLRDRSFSGPLQHALGTFLTELGNGLDAPPLIESLGSTGSDIDYWQAAYLKNLGLPATRNAARKLVTGLESRVPGPVTALSRAELGVGAALPDAEDLPPTLRADLLVLEAERALFEDGDPRVALSLAQSALTHRPSDARVLEMAALSLAFSGRSAEAVTVARRAAAQEPLLDYFDWTVALSLALAGQSHDAVKLVADKEPATERYALIGALLYEIAGDTAGALGYWQRWLSIAESGGHESAPVSSYRELIALAPDALLETHSSVIAFWTLLADRSGEGADGRPDAASGGLARLACTGSLGEKLSIKC